MQTPSGVLTRLLAEQLLDLLIAMIGSTYHRIWLYAKYPDGAEGMTPLNKREQVLVFCASFFVKKKPCR